MHAIISISNHYSNIIIIYHLLTKLNTFRQKFLPVEEYRIQVDGLDIGQRLDGVGELVQKQHGIDSNASAVPCHVIAHDVI